MFAYCSPVEVAIRNFKAHFFSVLAGVTNDFPLHTWDRLLLQTETKINLLCQSNATPKVSAYAHLSGPFGYNKTPLATMGCTTQIHMKLDERGMWAYHSVDGWYLAIFPEHYCTHVCYVRSTRIKQLTDTAQFSHKNITDPTITHDDKVMHTISDCAKALKGLGQIGGPAEMRQLKQLADLTKQAV